VVLRRERRQRANQYPNVSCADRDADAHADWPDQHTGPDRDAYPHADPAHGDAAAQWQRNGQFRQFE
jgi:hypothetical protein